MMQKRFCPAHNDHKVAQRTATAPPVQFAAARYIKTVRRKDEMKSHRKYCRHPMTYHHIILPHSSGNCTEGEKAARIGLE
jgi:hypothetical protein